MALPVSTSTLADELATDPLGRGYAAMSDEAVAASLMAVDRPRARLVSRGDLRQRFDNLADAQGMPVWETIEAHRNDQGALGIACRAALRLRDAPGDYPPIDVSAPMFQAQLAALVAGGVLTQEQAEGITAMGVEMVSRAEELGLGRVKPGYVAAARAS